jgi:LuxR family maltose regulon positive regulatory protein
MEQELGQSPEPETFHLYEEIRDNTTSTGERNQPQTTIQRAAPAEIEIPIIKTKLFLPKIPHNLVRRPKLVSLLDQGTQLPLTILSASAGFGKTTLLAEWAAQSHMPVAWLGLDQADYDPHCLASYITSAIRGVLSGSSIGSEALSLLRTSSPLPIESIISSLINDLLQVPKPVVLVLDDFHVLQNKAAYDLINFLLGHQPHTLRLIISTRVDPALSLARMRANLQLFEIRTNNLRFSFEEARIFLNEVMKLAVLEEDISILSERTEGWIAGYKMASLVIQAYGENAAYN